MVQPVPTLKNELRLHYRCDFEVGGELSKTEAFAALIREVRQWLTDTRKIPKQAVAGAWFYNEGEWVSPERDRSSIRTSRLGREDEGNAVWAFRYEHPSSSKYEPKSPADSFRIWRTDIALNCDAGKHVHFSLQTAHYLLPSYFGPEPAEPEPNSPKIIKNIIGSEQLRAFSGSEPLLTAPNTVAPNDAPLLWQRIIDPDRHCPLVYAARDFQTGEPVANMHGLAWGLAGLATIYVAESSWVDKTTELALPENYRCWNGKVRVYLPGVNPGLPDDYKRHRYFTPEQIQALGDTEFQKLLVRSFARRLLYTFDARPKTIDDLRQMKQYAQLKALKTKADATASLEDMVALLNELNADLEASNREQERQLRSAHDRIESLELGQQEAEFKLASAEYQANSAREQATKDAKAAQQLQREMEAYRSLARLPRSISDCGDFFTRAFPGKLVFSERGLASLRRASYSDMPGFWEALWAMASHLHKLFFDTEGKLGDIEKKFKELSGIQMSMTEGSLTKADKRLMKKREDTYNGEKVDITPHIKLRSGNEHFRIYFGVVQSEKLLVIGDCTDHLETAGTRRRGQ
jgi:hypothetical protein